MPLGRKRSALSNESAGLSEYELKRRSKMAENAQFMQSLGMARAQLNMTRQLQSASSSTKEAKTVKPNKAAAAPKSVRRSSRLRGALVRTAVVERRKRSEEKRKQEISVNEAKRRRYLVARRKREAAIAAAAAERRGRAENRSEQ